MVPLGNVNSPAGIEVYACDRDWTDRRASLRGGLRSKTDRTSQFRPGPANGRNRRILAIQVPEANDSFHPTRSFVGDPTNGRSRPKAALRCCSQGGRLYCLMPMGCRLTAPDPSGVRREPHLG
jgi:hypothetical protein